MGKLDLGYLSPVVVSTRPDTDSFDLTVQIDHDQRRLGDLLHDLIRAIQLKTAAKVSMVEADASVSACRAEVEILKVRIMAKQSLLRAIPR